jgi:hypothetical protein
MRVENLKTDEKTDAASGLELATFCLLTLGEKYKVPSVLASGLSLIVGRF